MPDQPADKQLREYAEKRAFGRTPEPAGQLVEAREGPLLFCIQKHAARQLHYDLRLEAAGVLKSWAVPKGPSDEPTDKKFAAQTEDHPFAYAAFEGQIPKGEYGGGEVIVWDCGTYWPDEAYIQPTASREEQEAAVLKGLEEGKLSVFMRGTKLKGSWALVRMKNPTEWLFFKHGDRYAKRNPGVLELGASVLSARTVEDIARGFGEPSGLSAGQLAPYGARCAYPPRVEPMLATLSDTVFDSPDWIYEPKLDGIRALAFANGDVVKLVTRRGQDFTAQFPDLVARLRAQRMPGAVLDGEIVAFQPDGKATFHAMQQRLNLSDAGMIARADVELPTVFYAFDLLHFGGWDTTGLPLTERKRLLEQVLLPDERVSAVATVRGQGRALFSAAIQTGMEGVVAKRADSRYEPGKRSKHWLKVKATLSGDFVVGGFTKGEGSRSATFGALALGYFRNGKLVPVGNVGSGFDEDTLAALTPRLQELTVPTSPFEPLPEDAQSLTWVRPEIVVEAKYNEVTPIGSLRAPVFVKVRHDKSPAEVTDLQTEYTVAEAVSPSGGHAESREEMIVRSVVEQLQAAKRDATLQIGDHELAVTNLDKVLWPGDQPATKRDLLVYLARISPWMLTHTRDRPLTMIRFPEGIHGEKFFQKHWDQRKPAFVESVDLYGDTNSRDQTYILANNLPTLLWLGQLGTLEFHVPAVRCVPGPDGQALGRTFTGSMEALERSLLNYPDFIEFDLDPYLYSGHEAPGDEPELFREGFEQTKTAAFWMKALLESLGLKAFVKTTGKTGLHLFAPIVRDLDYDAVRVICEMLCRSLEREHPNELTTEWSVPKRTGKVFLDYNMNSRLKTLGSAFSPRALPTQAVSVPLSWTELRDAYPTDFTLRTAPDFMQGRADAWADILDAKADLSKIAG